MLEFSKAGGDHMDKEKYFSTINEFLESTTSQKMLILALREIVPKKGTIFSFAILFLLGAVLAVKIGLSENTIEISLTIIEILLNALIAIFGCIFAVYSILLAFLSDSYIEKLSKINYGNDVSYLKTSTTYYESVLFLYFIALGITGILLLFLNCLEPNYALTSNQIFNNYLTVILLNLYFTFVLRVFYELKSIIYNTIVLFRSSIAYKLLAFAKSEKEGKTNDNDK